MSNISWKNVKDNLCVICQKSLDSSSYHKCLKCNKVCKIKYRKISDDICDVKSVCCHSDVEIHNKITCSDDCHDSYMKKAIIEFGEFKKVIDLASGKAHRVPTALIIQCGLKQEDLKKFPVW